MAITITGVPTTIREPLFYAQIDPSRANTLEQPHVALLIGQITSSGSLHGAASLPVQLATSQAVVDGLCGQGSQLSELYRYFRRQNLLTTVWILPLEDDAAAAAATGTIAVTGTPTASGTLALYVDGIPVPVLVTSAMTATEIGAAIAAAITANDDLPVTATAATGTVTVTAKNKGLCGNDLDLRANYYGNAGGEVTPAGITVTITAMANGTTNPSTGLATALALLPDTAYDYVGHPYSDTACLNALQSYFGDSAGQWAPTKMLYGGGFTAARGTLAALQTLGVARNDPHMSIIGAYDSPSGPAKWAGAYAGQAALSLAADPATPFREVPLVGILPPPVATQFQLADRNTLLWSGISTFRVVGGQVILSRSITTYQRNSFGSPDNSELSVEKLFTLAEGIRALKGRVESVYGRVKLADDGTRFGPGANVVTPATIKADMIAFYDDYLVQGKAWFQDTVAFAAGLVVERDASDPDRVNVLWDGIVMDQLNVFALLAQFRQTGA